MSDIESCPGCGNDIDAREQICEDCKDRELEANNRMREVGINPHKLEQ